MIVMFLLTLFAGLHFYLLGGTWGKRMLAMDLEGPDTVLVGLMLHYVLIGLINLFLPIGLVTTIGLTCLSILTYPRLSAQLFRDLLAQRRWLILVIGMLLLLAPYWGGEAFMYDHYLYHDQSVKWFHAYALPAGLGNLHGRFGFNHAFFPVVSSFQMGSNSHWYFINILLFLVFLMKVGMLLVRPDTGWVFRAGILCLTGAVIHYGSPYLSGISPDLQVAVLVGYLMMTLAANGWTWRHPGFVLSLAAFIVVTKVNMAVFAVCLGIIVLWQHWGRDGVIRMLLLPMAVGIVWVARSVVMTGQLMYPLPGLHLELFSFAIPLERIEEMRIAITGWARSPGEGYAFRYQASAEGFSWVRDWYAGRASHAYAHLPGDVRISLRVFLWLVVGVVGWSIVRLILRRRGLGIPGLILICLIANLGFWFFTGPDFRFGFPIFQALLFMVVVSGVGGSRVRWIVLSFLLVTLPFQLKNTVRAYLTLVHRLPAAEWWRGYPASAVGFEPMVEDWIPAADGTDSFRYVYPATGDRARLDMFPAAPYRLEGVVFERRGGRLEFRER